MQRINAAIGLALVSLFVSVWNSAFAQTTKDVAGIWIMTSSTIDHAGVKQQPFGASPRGVLFLDVSGRYVLTVAAPDLPKFASNNRTTGTPAENTAIVKGSISHFGTYAVVDNALVFRIETSTFPNWDGMEQKRPFKVSEDELTFTVPATSAGGVALATFKRAK
jgi:hypothetical protein